MPINKRTLATLVALTVAVTPIVSPAVNSLAASSPIRTTTQQTAQTTNTFTPNHSNADSPLNAPNRISRTARINFVPGYSIQVWTMSHTYVTDPDGRRKKLRDGTTVQVYGKSTANGATYYQIGNNEWVDGAYLSIGKE